MTQSSANTRPMVLSILCGLGFVGCFLKMILIISPVVQSHGQLYAVYLCLSSVLLIGCLAGIWLMKRWAFWAFLAYAVMDQWVYWQMGYWDIKAFTLTGLILLANL